MNSRSATRNAPKPAGYHWDAAEMVVRPDGLAACRGCKGPVYPPKRAWCNDPTCQEAWSVKISGQAGCRAICWDRDRGVCKDCGLDTVAVEREYGEAVANARLDYLGRMLGETLGLHHATLRARRNAIIWSKGYVEAGRDCPEGVEIAERYGVSLARLKAGKTLWEADHIVEIADGGEWHDPDNLRTLCHPCHAAKSARNHSGRRRLKLVKMEGGR